MRPFLLTVFFFIFQFNIFCQSRPSDFNIALPTERVPNSMYKTIRYLDSRLDTTNMGFVQLGVFNRKATVIPKMPFSIQITHVLNALLDSTAKTGEMLFQFRQFGFAEVTGSLSEKGYCYFRAQLYAKTDSSYQIINSIDTIIIIKAMDVTQGLFRNASKTITGFIEQSLTKKATDSISLNMKDIEHLDSFEKRKIAVYNTPQYAEGLYLNYKSFKNQVPDKPVFVEMKKEKMTSVRMNDENGKKVKCKAKGCYAFVFNGQPYVVTEYGYYPLHKENDELIFTGRAKVTANSADVIAASVLFGIVGGLLASDAEATFEMKIDHFNGGFIRLREIKTATN